MVVISISHAGAAMAAVLPEVTSAQDRTFIVGLLHEVEAQLHQLWFCLGNSATPQARLHAAYARGTLLAMMKSVDVSRQPAAALALRQFYCQLITTISRAVDRGEAAPVHALIAPVAALRRAWSEATADSEANADNEATANSDAAE